MAECQIYGSARSSRSSLVGASYCNKRYKISVAPSSFLTFTLCSLLTIALSLFRLIPTTLRPAPILSSFPDADFPSKLLGDSRNRTDMLAKLGTRASSSDVERTFCDVDLRIAKKRDIERDRNNIIELDEWN